MIDLDQITFKYLRSKRPQFENFSLRIDSGGIYGLLGRNGAGKSTLLYLIAGLLKVRQGKVFCNGFDMNKRPIEVLSDMFLVGEEYYLPPVSLDEFLRLNVPFYPKFDRELLDRSLEIFEMERKMNLKRLSMGQRKKVIISFALATNCGMVIMDEPTNGLDIPAKSQFRKIVAGSMTDDKIVLISTHQVRDLEQLMDRVLILEGGRMLLEAPIDLIEERLLFEEYDRSRPDALFETSSAKGFKGVLENTDGSPSVIDMEILFNGAIAQPEKISRIFNR